MFQRMVQSCISRLPFSRVYIDDNIVGSQMRTTNEQLEVQYEHVRDTLLAFRKFKVTLRG